LGGSSGGSTAIAHSLTSAAHASEEAAAARGGPAQPGGTVTPNHRGPAAATAVLASAAVTSAVDAPAQRTQPKSGRGPAAASAQADLIVERMDATRKWISAHDTRAYSIQLFVAEDEEQLRSTLKSLVKFVELDDVYVYRSSGRGREMVSVLWGNFPDRKAALRGLAELPPHLQANRPYLRTSHGVRAEIERSGDRVRR
jgi:septal ring-binding cell division protein DamX